MRDALKGIPEKPLIRPEGLISVRIDPITGLRATTDTKNTTFEIFRTEKAPQKAPQKINSTPTPGEDEEAIEEQLF